MLSLSNPAQGKMVKLVCAVVGEVGSAFGLEIDDGEQVWKAKEVIALKLKYTGLAKDLQLFLAKTDAGWLTQLEALDGVNDTRGYKQLRFAGAKLRVVGLASGHLGEVSDEEEAAGKGPVHVLVVVPKDTKRKRSAALNVETEIETDRFRRVLGGMSCEGPLTHGRRLLAIV
ncbi:unnamed protein product [Phytophthora lilii]|uniref:Unnamed protein product n=1 Tax=Phytophthora lilii TaxID=2077276 RepID=A0A9W6TGB0_9STRA|nr:unnamed protein product [Phytophthora lilii]